MRDGECVIGMKSVAMIPLISFDSVVNIYLTIIFLIPLRSQYKNTVKLTWKVKVHAGKLTSLQNYIRTRTCRKPPQLKDCK